MSRIGKLPVPLKTGVQAEVGLGVVAVRGPKGSIQVPLARGIKVAAEGSELVVRRADDSKRQKSLHGLTRALIANAVEGVSGGFTKRLEIHGVGYGAEVKGPAVQFKLGYSHPVVFPIAAGIEVRIDRNVLTITGCDRQQVGQVAADIRALRPPDVYKQKGIRYQGEILRKKAGKAGAK